MGKLLELSSQPNNTHIMVNNNDLRITLCAGFHDMEDYWALIDKYLNITILGDLRLGISKLYSSAPHFKAPGPDTIPANINIVDKTITIYSDNLDYSQIVIGDKLLIYSPLDESNSEEMYRFILPIIHINKQSENCYSLTVYSDNPNFEKIASEFYISISPNCYLYNIYKTIKGNNIKIVGISLYKNSITNEGWFTCPNVWP